MSSYTFPLKVLAKATLKRVSDGQPITLENLFIFDTEEDFQRWLRVREQWVRFGGKAEEYKILS